MTHLPNSFDREIGQLHRAIDSLIATLNQAVRLDSISVNHLREKTEQIVFLKHELLFFSNLSKSQVIQELNNLGVDISAVSIITNGAPIFFTDSLVNDVTSFPDYYLVHTDLPYGFPNDDGTFQFSSPEITRLKKSIGPHIIDDVYYYLGTDGRDISYESFTEKSAEKRLRPQSYGLGWCKWRTKQTILSEYNQGRLDDILVNVKYKMSGNKMYYQHPVDKELYLKTVENTSNPGIYDRTRIVGSPESKENALGDNYRPNKFLGWSFGTYAPGANKSYLKPLLQMPPGQLSSFEVNPFPQVPYRGAEGVYPVIMVEFNRDMVLNV